MATITVSMQVPEEMAPYLCEEDKDKVFIRNAMILYPLIQDMTISHGRAAEILGVHKFDLIDFYDSIGLPYLQQSVNDLEAEMADIRALKGASLWPSGGPVTKPARHSL